MKRKKIEFGMSVVEVLVATIVALCIGLAVYRFFSSASRLAAIAETKGMIRQEAQVILRALERDVSSSRIVVEKKLLSDNTERYKSTLVSTPTSLTVEVPKVKDAQPSNSSTLFDFVDDNDEQDYEKVTYSWGKGILKRNEQVLGSHVDKININKKADMTYDGKVDIEIVMSAIPRGCTEPATHTENLIVAVRQLQTKMLEKMDADKDPRNNKYWRQKIRNDDDKGP